MVNKLKHFKPEEFSDFSKMNQDLLERLDALRSLYGKPIIITSDYRPPYHPLEASKTKPGTHTYGVAVDIASVGGKTTLLLVMAALDVGFRRIGINRKKKFIHLDIADRTHNKPQSIWTYD